MLIGGLLQIENASNLYANDLNDVPVKYIDGSLLAKFLGCRTGSP